MKLKYIIITIVTTILCIFLAIGLMVRGLVKNAEAELIAEERAQAKKDAENAFYEGRSESDPKIEPEILGITLGTSFGEVLKNPAIQTSTQIKYSGKGRGEPISVADLSKIYEDAKANMDDLASVKKFVNNPHATCIIKLTGNHEYLGFQISELYIGTTYSPQAQDFLVDSLAGSLNGDLEEISWKISRNFGKLSYLYDPKRQLPSSTEEWRGLGKHSSTVSLTKTCQVGVESRNFDSWIKGEISNQQIALNAGYVKLDVQKSIREAKEKLEAAQKRMEAEAAQQKQESEHPDTPGGNQ
jgi:hypothetical protein